MINFRSFFVCSIFFVFLFVSNTSFGQSFVPSPQQIEQFKNLPRAQQEALARQMGFDISILDGLNSAGPQQLQSQTPVEVVERQVDEKQVSETLARQSIAEEQTKKLKTFGYSLFNSGDTSFTPLTNMPVPSDYVLGTGDSFVLKLFGNETGTFDLSVDPEGTIDIPELGPLNAMGMTYQELKKAIEEKYSQQKIGVKPFLSVSQLRTIQVFLVGEVFRPGSLNVSSLATVSTALFNSGGVSELGSLRNIELKRAGKTVAVFDLYDLMIKGDVTQDVRLQQGDVIFVPLVTNIVSIDGEVRRPAIYEFKQGESLANLVELAGGTLPNADSSAVQVVRNNLKAGLSISTVNLKSAEAERFTIKTGDFVNVQLANLEFVDAVRVLGAINSPSLVSVLQKTNLSDLVTPTSLLKSTDVNYALVVRKPKFAETTDVISFSPKAVLDGQFDLALQAFDEVLFFDSYTNEDKANAQAQKIVNSGVRASNAGSLKTDNDLLSEERGRSFTTSSIGIKPSQNKVFTRKELLAPVIAALRSESNQNNESQLVQITGEVKFAGIYPIPSNDASLSGLITAAGGLLESAHLEQAEISKFNIEGETVKITHQLISLLSQLTRDKSQQYQLESKDVLKIARIPDWFESNTVELRGEFVFPGFYQISRGETLSSVVARAGGLTEKASPEASVFMREELKQRERQNIDQSVADLRQQLAANNLSNSQFSRTIDYENATNILNELTNVAPVGRLVIDFEGLMAGNMELDVELKDGDVIVLPNITPAVSVIGEVFVPTTHFYDASLTIEDYIKLSGGAREYADNGSLYIVKANGEVVVPERGFWFDGENGLLIAPGDTIVVPRDVTNYETISVWQGITQIVYQTAVALAAIGSL